MISSVVSLDDFPAMIGRLLQDNTENKVQVAPN
jgi:hypothetical protein